MSDSPDTVQWLTYKELADLRGIAAASAKRQAFRLGWRCQVDPNGTTRVAVPLTALANRRARNQDKRGHRARHGIQPDPPLAAARERIVGLELAQAALCAAHRDEIDRLVAEHESAQRRIAQDHATEIGRMSAAHEAEIERLIAAHATELVRIDRIGTEREDERLGLAHAHVAELERLIAAHEAEIERLTAVHAAELARRHSPEPGPPAPAPAPARRVRILVADNSDQTRPPWWRVLRRRR